MLKSLDSPVRKCEGHRRVISERLVAREEESNCEVLNSAAVGLGRKGSEQKCKRLNELT